MKFRLSLIFGNTYSTFVSPSHFNQYWLISIQPVLHSTSGQGGKKKTRGKRQLPDTKIICKLNTTNYSLTLNSQHCFSKSKLATHNFHLFLCKSISCKASLSEKISSQAIHCFSEHIHSIKEDFLLLVPRITENCQHISEA